jgi:hypothetical protein
MEDSALIETNSTGRERCGRLLYVDKLLTQFLLLPNWPPMQLVANTVLNLDEAITENV